MCSPVKSKLNLGNFCCQWPCSGENAHSHLITTFTCHVLAFAWRSETKPPKFQTECMLVEMSFLIISMKQWISIHCLTLHIANVKGGEMEFCLWPDTHTQFWQWINPHSHLFYTFATYYITQRESLKAHARHARSIGQQRGSRQGIYKLKFTNQPSATRDFRRTFNYQYNQAALMV